MKPLRLYRGKFETGHPTLNDRKISKMAEVQMWYWACLKVMFGNFQDSFFVGAAINSQAGGVLQVYPTSRAPAIRSAVVF